MTNVPTAEEIYNDFQFNYKGDENRVLEAMREFAKLHVKSALKAASEKARIKANTQQGNSMFIDDFEVKKESVLNSYPLENII